MQIFSYIYFLSCIHLCSSTSCDINEDNLVSKGQKLVGFRFWSAPTTNFMSCVKACVRVRLCASVNYDLSTKFCDLNKVSSTNHPESVKNSADVLHSNIAGWPSKIDPDCFGRPCAENEVCVPGNTLGSNTCGSYSCMKFKVAKPKSTPSPATPTKASTSVTQTSTTPTPASITAAPQGSSQTQLSSQPSTDMPTEGSIRLIGGQGNKGGLKIFFQKHWRSVVRDGWNWRATRTACNELGYYYGGSYRPTDMGTGDSHKVIVTECTANTEKLSDCNIQYVQQGTVSSGALKIMCHERNYTELDVQIRNTNTGSSSASNMEGLAEVRYKNEWRTLCGDHWRDEEIDVFCKSKNANWRKENFRLTDWKMQASGTISNVHCDGDEPHIFYCRRGTQWRHCSHKTVVTVSCQPNSDIDKENDSETE